MVTFSFTKKEFPTADFELITSDGTSLHVHRSILEVASPFFQDMFSLPQPNSASAQSLTSPAANFVYVTEDARTMSTLLSLVYPLPLPSTSRSVNQPPDLLKRLSSPATSLIVLANLLSLSQKYILPLATSKLSSVLLHRALSNPRAEALRVYAIGCRYDVPELVRGGARATWSVGEGALFDLDEKKSEESSPLTDEGNPEGTAIPEIQDEVDMQDEDAESVTEFENGHSDTDDSIPRLRNRVIGQQVTPVDILKQISAWDFQRLLRLHRLRSSFIKSLILSPESDPFSSPPAAAAGSPPSQKPLGKPPPCPQCSSTAHFGLSLDPKWYQAFQELAPLEMDRSGPNLDQIFSADFLAECIGRGCARCGSSLMGRDGRAWLENFVARVKAFDERLEM